MLKFIITAVIIYFIVRSISNKPWLGNQMHVNQDKTPQNRSNQPTSEDMEGDYVEYEEVE